MGKATKAADNVYYCARMAAAEYNDNLASREGASDVLGIDRTRLARIELGTIVPYPDEVRLMADTYNAPQLMNYHCTRDCPIGRCIVPEARPGNIEQVALRSAKALRDTQNIREALIDIAADGKITAEERPRLEQILEQLNEVSRVAIELQTIVRQYNSRGEDNHND